MGSISVSFTAPPIVAPSQTYTVEAYTNSSMKNGCFTNSNYTSGADFTVVTPPVGPAGTSYFVQVTANGSSRYLVSPPSAQVSQTVFSEIGASGTPSGVTSSKIGGAIVVTFASFSGIAPSSYTATACTVMKVSASRASVGNYISGVTQLIGLQSGASYCVQVVAVGPTGFANNSSVFSTNSPKAN